jgi:beta-glucosidase
LSLDHLFDWRRFSNRPVVELYVSDHAKTVTTPPQELRGFTKTYLQPDQSERVRITVARNDLEHFSIAARSWVYEGGPSPS